MVMVGRVIEKYGKTTVTSFLIKEDNVFVEDGLFREPGLIENIAQSAAAGMSCCAGKAGEEPRLGFIGAVRDLKILRLPSAGDEIKTTVTVTNEIFNATVVAGTTRLLEEVIAECELRIFIEQAGER